MKQSLNQAIPQIYPEWQNQPMRLTNAEMEDPATVLENFFDSYSLRGLRGRLRQLLCDALVNKEGSASESLLLHDDIEKLIEAAWIINEREYTEFESNQRGN